MRKDKQKVLEEVLTEDQIRGFLLTVPPSGISADYNCIEKAYRGLVARDFAQFIGFFVESGRDLNATNEYHQTMLDVVVRHAASGEYAEILRNAGAKHSD